MVGGSTESYGESADELPPELLVRLKSTIPGYRLLKEIARGGQAIVYKAYQESTGKTVAIKLLKEGALADDSARERLKREVRILVTLNHPNIATVIDSGETPDAHAYLVMNYIVGRPLDKFLSELDQSDNVPVDPSFLLRLFLRICDAVNAAHLRGITHRDLSPSNIMIDERNEPVILDFGLARTAFDRFFNANRSDLTVSNQFIGKVAYASPEQARGKPDLIDIRTDVYALGVVLYQILTGGEFPYDVVGSIADVLNNIIHVKPTPPSKLIEAMDPSRAGKFRSVRKRHPPVVNAVIEAIVLKSLEKWPADRYQSAGELAQDIRNYLSGQPTTARIATDEVDPKRWTKTPVSGIAAGALVLASICTFLIAIAWFLNRPRTLVAVDRPKGSHTASLPPKANLPSAESDPLDSLDTATRQSFNRAFDLVTQAETVSSPVRQMQLANEARKLILPFVRDLDQSIVSVWNLAARIAILCRDRSLAILASEALTRLASSSTNSTLRKLEVFVDQEELHAWSQGRPQCLKLYAMAKSDNHSAMNQLGGVYEHGRYGMPRDEIEAVNWYRLAAAAGDELAVCRLGSMYANGFVGIEKDETEAVEWFRRGAAAGNGGAMAYLGSMYKSGRGGLQADEVQAVNWFRRGAEAGNGRAMACLGVMYENGSGGLKEDEAKAVYWYRKGASNDEFAMFCLAGAYLTGQGGLPKDATSAATWFTKAASFGEPYSMFNLGQMHEKGQGGLLMSMELAAKWYRQAAQYGNKESQRRLQKMGLSW